MTCYPSPAQYPVLPIYRYRITFADVLQVVSNHTGIPADHIADKTRLRQYVRARHLCMWLARNLRCGGSLHSIARRLGCADHTNVIHGLQAIDRDIQYEPGLRETVAKLRDELKRLQLQHELTNN